MIFKEQRSALSDLLMLIKLTSENLWKISIQPYKKYLRSQMLVPYPLVTLCIACMSSIAGSHMSCFKQIRKDIFRPALICANIDARTKLLTISSLVLKSGFISTQAKKGVGLYLVSLLIASQGPI